MRIEIEGESYLALIDTGSSRSFMRKDILNKIGNKDHISDSDCINIYGNKYLNSNFQIPEIKIGDFLTGAVFKEEDENFLADCVVGNHPLIAWKVYLMYQVFREAIIGVDVFRKFVCVFDFPHSSIFLASEMDPINEAFPMAEFHSVPFEMGKGGVVLTFETDLGEKRLALDAGSTLSIMKFADNEVAEFVSNTLIANGLDFGRWKFRVMDLAKEMDDVDGLLGIEFFNKNIICLDFPNKMAYIQSPQLGSKERFTYWVKSYFGK